ELAVHVHGQARQRGVRRQREVEGALQLPVFLVEIGLVDGGAREAVLDVDVDVIAAQGDLRLLAVGGAGAQGAAGVAAGRPRRRPGRCLRSARRGGGGGSARRRGGLVCLGRQLLAGP